MKQLSGHGISGGVAAGKLVTLLSAQTGVPRETSRTPDEELQRFAQALREGLWELDALQETVRTQTSAEAAQIFEIHKMMLQDEDFCTAVRERLKAEAISCEYAVQQTGKQFETLFSAMDDPYMKTRSADVRDVASRLLRCLRGGADAAALPDARCIIAAEELTPSQTIRLDREKVAAFVTARGTANSHAAILARTMGIPAVTGVDMASLFAKNGAEAIVDAETGAVFLEPDEQTCTRYDSIMRKQQSTRCAIQSGPQVPLHTAGGRRLRLFANVGSSSEVAGALQNGAEGIGLFRSEFLYLGRENAPSEQEQFLQYRAAAEQMDGRMVIVRTLDLGADKQADGRNNMKQLSGHGISGGVAAGKLVTLLSAQTGVPRETSRTPDEELQRFAQALREGLWELDALQETVRTQTSAEAAQIFEIHKMMLQDEDFCTAVRERLKAEAISCEYAVQQTGKQFETLFSAMDDPYMKTRSADVRDVASRLLRCLRGGADAAALPDARCIIAAEELTPSQTIRLDREKVAAFVTARGTANSHAAILARTMGIPAVTGVDMASLFAKNGAEAIVDAETGAVFLEPDEQTCTRYDSIMRKQQSTRCAIQSGPQVPLHTAGGRRLRLFANVGSSSEVAGALQNGAEGIGLFRSEFLYLGRENAPSEQEQFLQYRAAAEQMDGRMVIVRTLDLGADKQAEYLNLPVGPNPALGYRAIRICLAQPDLFRVQLRAICRAAAFGTIAVMFPMITSVWQVRQSKQILADVQQTLRDEGETDCPDIPVGVMIETPAAALLSDALAQEVDFFSIGTNDLTQYTLAADRQEPSLEAYYEPRHEAVLRLIEMSVQSAHRHGIWVGVCGELAADLALTDWFYDLEVDELSVSPPMLPRLYQQLSKR